MDRMRVLHVIQGLGYHGNQAWLVSSRSHL